MLMGEGCGVGVANARMGTEGADEAFGMKVRLNEMHLDLADGSPVAGCPLRRPEPWKSPCDEARSLKSYAYTPCKRLCLGLPGVAHRDTIRPREEFSYEPRTFGHSATAGRRWTDHAMFWPVRAGDASSAGRARAFGHG